MHGPGSDWNLEPAPRCFVLQDYTGAVARWCPGCGDHAVLGAVQRLVRDEQIPPEKTVVVSGIGCSSRFPHYMKTYGFHGLHGRPLPVASGVRCRREDLEIFVVTGDGDCCAIGTAHWIHAVRYNMRMTVMLLDNQIYGLTKMQSSPTTPMGRSSLTHPSGTTLPPLNPLSVTLGITNASFVAQTVDWNPPHLYATLKTAHAHRGLSFVRILQRCPHFMPHDLEPLQQDPSRLLLLTHPGGIEVPEPVRNMFPNQLEHDPADIDTARKLVVREDAVPVGLLYHDASAHRYDKETAAGVYMGSDERIEAVQSEVDRFLI